MWQETFGPHDLVHLHGSIYGHRVCILIDDGAMHNFLNYTLVKKLKLPETKSSHRYVVSTIKGDDHDVWDTQVQQVPVFVQEHTMVLDFQVMNMSCADVILGREWLHGLGSSLKRSYEHNTIAFEANGKHVLLLGERDVPPSPLICNAELSYLEHSNQIEEVYFCYCVSQSSQIEVDHVSSCNESSSAMHSISFSPSQLSLNNLKQPIIAPSLQQLLQEFMNVFPNELPEGLPPK